MCPFLRSVSSGAFRAPLQNASAANRCVAGGPAEPQPLDWQRAACLTASHVRCPRYSLGVDGPAIPLVVDEPPRGSEREAAPVAAAVVMSTGELAEPAAVPAGAAPPAAPATSAAAPAAAAAPNDGELVRGSRLMTPAIAISLTLLVLAAGAAISFVAVAGGLQLPTSPPSGAVLASPTPGIVPSLEPSAAPRVSRRHRLRWRAATGTWS